MTTLAKTHTCRLLTARDAYKRKKQLRSDLIDKATFATRLNRCALEVRLHASRVPQGETAVLLIGHPAH